MSLARPAGLLLLLALVAPGEAIAQTSMGVVNGTVTDATGGLVPGATVTLVSEATNVQSVRQTGPNGYFVFVNVRPGTYTLTIELAGMKTARVSGFVVGVNETLTRNVSLEVGALEEVVEVTAHSELLQASSTELGNVIEEKVISEMPLQGRNFTQLLVLTPGVNPVSTAQGAGQNGSENFGMAFEGASGIPGGYINNASIQGQQNRSKVYYVDGIINTSVRAGSYVALPDIDSLQEFKVQSHGDKAEFGGVTGGVINMTSKSGSNRFRGSAFVFYRDEGLTARNPYRDVSAGRPTSPPEFQQGQFGVNVGGPIIKDKTFFFASYDGWRYTDSIQIRAIVPPNDNWLNGDFTGFRPIYNPYTTRVVNGVLVRDPFPNNQVPQSLISPTMQQLLGAYMVRPNLSGADVVNNFNYVDFREETNDSNAFQFRIDHHFSAKDNIFFRWTERRITGYLPQNDVAYKTPEATNRNFGGGWYHMFSPNMILEVRGGVATQPTEDAPMEHPAGLAPQQGTALPSLDELQGYVISGLSTSPWSLQANQLGVQGPRPRENPNWNVAADLTWLRGQHNFKAGFQMLRISRLQKNQFGELIYAADPTRNAQGSGSTGDVLASALLGLPGQIRGYVPDLGFIEFHTSTLSGYVQDQWSVKPNLTLTYGLRYDYITRAYGESGTFQSGPDLRTGEWLLSLPETPPVCSTVGNQPPCLPKPLDQIPYNQYIRVMGEYDAVLPPIKDNFGPRVGLAWQINPETVLRTGYSLMWDSMVSRSQYGQHQFETWGWPQVSGFDTGTINTIGGAIQPLESFSSLGIGAPRAEPWNSTGYFNAPDRKNAYSHQWNLEIQRQLTRNLMVGVAYVGSYNGRMEYSGRAAAPTTAAIDPATGRRLTPAERNALRPWAHITGDFRYSDDIGMSKYNAFQLKAQQRFAEGFTSMLSYTWSSTIDTSSGWFDAEGGIGGRPVQNYWDKDDARGTSAYDIPHILTWASIWELPVGRGKRWLNDGALSWVLGNWQLSWMLLARSGQPMTVTAGGDPANLGFSNYSRADLVGDPHLDDPTPDLWFNKAAFAAPVNTFGSSDRNILRAPSYWNLDLTLQKNVPLGSARQLELRLELFNVFNHINDGNPNTDITNANYARITGMSGRPRQVQFGLRFVY